MFSTKKFAVAVITSLLFLSCSTNSSEITAQQEKDKMATPAVANTQREPTSYIKKIIREGSMRFEAKNLEETRKSVVSFVEASGGYVSKEIVAAHNGKAEAELTVKIPVSKFDGVVAQLQTLASRLDSKQITAMDVSAEYLDTEARLRNKKELIEKYLQLLKQATKMEDAIALEREVSQQQAEAEVMQGHLKLLDNQVAYSTLNLVFYDGSDSSGGFAQQIGSGLKNGWKGLLWFLLLLINLWPLLMAGGLTLLFIYLYGKRRKH